MRAFYFFWFFFCAGWGYLLAGFGEVFGPTWAQITLSFPLALLVCAVLFWLELQRLPLGQLAQPPSFKIKPWNRPTGLLLFLGLTFTFISSWGVIIALVTHITGLRITLYFLAISCGCVGAILVCRQVFPEKFGT
jgi:hypothetical protein